jgi:hypothetical protein
MKQLYTILLFAASLITAHAQTGTFCDMNGNVVIYSNYDGGPLTINVDQNIPNLKIGVLSYEFCTINITGTYASNVTAVWSIGYNGNSNACNLNQPYTTTISGVPASVDSILLYPAATYSNPYGNNTMYCTYSCSTTTSQGGCNTADQTAHYFLTHFGGTLYFQQTQYSCWQGTMNISAGGNCCANPLTEVEENSISSLFTVNPNPANGSTIVSTPAYSNTSTLEIVNVLGEIVRTVNIAAGTMQTIVSLDGLESGVYMFRMQNDSEITTTAVVVSE